MMPLQIQTRESATNDALKNNVLENLELIETWMGDRYAINDKTAHLVSFGKSFRDNPAQVEQLDGGDLFCVKHALPLFDGLSVKPKYCVILDPREVDGISTLGYKRADVLKVYPETTYLVASMTHPSVTKFLLDKGAKVVGWHSACEAMKDPEVAKKVRNWVVGGSCSAMRAVSIAQLMGYRKVTLTGYDAIVPEPVAYTKTKDMQLGALVAATRMGLSDQQMTIFKDMVAPALEIYGAKKIASMMPVPEGHASSIKIMEKFSEDGQKLSHMRLAIGDNLMWCTPELAAMAVDIERIFCQNTDIVYTNYSGGVCGALWDLYGGAKRINPIPQLEI